MTYRVTVFSLPYLCVRYDYGYSNRDPYAPMSDRPRPAPPSVSPAVTCVP